MLSVEQHFLHYRDRGDLPALAMVEFEARLPEGWR